MSMVFCRGCGKEIHESAPTCPHCGAQQVNVAELGKRRSVAKLIGWGLVWTAVFWVVSLMLAGMVAGMLDPERGNAAGAEAGQRFAGIFLLISIFLSTVLTITGLLPGTKKS